MYVTTVVFIRVIYLQINLAITIISGDCYWLLVCSGVLVCSGISTNRFVRTVAAVVKKRLPAKIN